MEKPYTFTMIFSALLLITGVVFAEPLNGEYTIGQNGTFKSMNAAVKSLQDNGISGPVWLSFEKGEYKEKVNIGNIKGANAMNTITFDSKSGNNSDVVIESPADGSEYTISLKDASFISFENITISNSASTYGNVVKVDGNASNIGFKSCILNGVEGARTGSNNAVIYCTSQGKKDYFSFDDTELNNGSYGLYKKAETASIRTLISGCLFYNQYESGVVIDNEEAPVLTNNVVNSLSKFSDYKAVALSQCNGNTIISNNIINAANGRYAIYLDNCTGLDNNYASINANSISVGGTDAIYGIAINGNSDNQLINFNRIKLTIDAKQAANQAYYANNSTGKNVNLTNNLFYDLNTGGYTILGNTYKDFFNQLPEQNSSLSVSANGITIEKVIPIK
ncbi:MAG: hypothetical protein KF706_12910 [Chitinophagales bacterium]|nr:hypothetical protein [Chitinophagales bacterium]